MQKKDEQIKAVRTFLNVATLTVLSRKDMAVSFRNSTEELTEASTVKANAMVQIATNKALKIDAPKFNKKKFEEAADKFAEDSLIPSEQYQKFIERERFDLQSIRNFANEINRDPGIVLGRLQNDKKVDFNDWRMKPLRHKYKVRTVI